MAVSMNLRSSFEASLSETLVGSLCRCPGRIGRRQRKEAWDLGFLSCGGR